ncbi:MAG: Ig-like domain-containing protein [Planctomycetota bacterium]|jgi:hypothetical protein
MHDPSRKPRASLWMSVLVLAAGVLLTAGRAAAQAGAVQPLSGEVALKEQQVTFERQKEGQVVQVRWGKQEVPMTPAATTVDCGLSRDGEHLALLANGVRDSLDLYILSKKSGDFYRFQTDGGRRLRRDFNGGQGSWPWMEGSHLILFGYEKAGKLEFRAVSRSGQVHADRQLDLALKGWEIDADPDRGYVRVRFAGVTEPLEFHHPLSPRLELVNGLLEFGAVKLGSSSRRLLQLHNSGKRPLTLSLVLVSAQFELGSGEARQRQVAPGEHSRIAVIFKPKAAGPQEARMKLLASGSIRELLVVLRGEATAPTKPHAAATSKPTVPPTPDKTQPAPDKPPLAAPELLDHRVHPLGGGEVLLLGRIKIGAAGTADATGATGGVQQRSLSLRNAQTHREVSALADRDGRFHARLRVQDFVRIEIATADGARRSGWEEFGAVQPQLEIAGDDLIVRCLPDQQFLLLAVPPQKPADDGQETHGSARIFGSWRGRARSSGLMRYPLSFLGAKDKKAPLALVLVTEVDGEKRTSERLQVR